MGVVVHPGPKPMVRCQLQRVCRDPVTRQWGSGDWWGLWKNPAPQANKVLLACALGRPAMRSNQGAILGRLRSKGWFTPLPKSSHT